MTAEKTAENTTPISTLPATLPASLTRIVLTGFMGVGKTTVGRILADTLGWAFLDLDNHLEARAQSTIAEIFSRLGEPHFRRIESSALANALAHTHTVIALGGGTPEQLTNRLLLEQTPNTAVVFLDAAFPTLFDRCMLQSFTTPDHIRPVLASPEEAEARFRTRQPLYRRLAHIALPTTNQSPHQVSRSLIETLADHP